MSTPRYTVTERQIEQLKTIVEKLKIDDLKAAIKSADAMSTYLEMDARRKRLIRVIFGDLG